MVATADAAAFTLRSPDFDRPDLRASDVIAAGLDRPVVRWCLDNPFPAVKKAQIGQLYSLAHVALQRLGGIPPKVFYTHARMGLPCHIVYGADAGRIGLVGLSLAILYARSLDSAMDREFYCATRGTNVPAPFARHMKVALVVTGSKAQDGLLADNAAVYLVGWMPAEALLFNGRSVKSPDEGGAFPFEAVIMRTRRWLPPADILSAVRACAPARVEDMRSDDEQSGERAVKPVVPGVAPSL
jgi:hypothetical protein